MAIVDYLIGAVLTLAPLIAGFVMKIFPPKKINRFYGFKTKITAQNQQTWDYAHKVCANVLLIYSIIAVIIYSIVLLLHIFVIKKLAYLMIFLGLALAIVGVITAFLIVQIKTKNYSKQL